MKPKIIFLELTEGQVLAILDALPSSGYNQCITLMRKIDKQLESQIDDNFKTIRNFLKCGDKKKINALNDIYERMK